jgi:hypothetical protein
MKVRIVFLLAALAIPAQLAAETEVNLSGQVRVRAEIDAKSFDAAHLTRTFQIMRTRINVDALVNENAHAFVQFQDSRVLGGQDQFGSWQSGGLNDGKNVDIHQAYLRLDRIWVDGLGAQCGRFEFNLGNQRVFGAVGWHNVGRSWEGCLGWYQAESAKFSAFWLKAQEEQEVNSVLGSRDFDLYGGRVQIDKVNLDLFGVYEIDNDTLVRSSDNSLLPGKKLERLTFGLNLQRQLEQFDFDLSAVYQTGSMADSIDIAAMMIYGEAGYTFEGDSKGRLALGIDYASGDDTPGDNEHKAYNNLYYTGHKFRGYMDYFIGSGNAGLMDMMFRGKISPHPNWTVKGDLHYFKTAQDYMYPVDVIGTMATTSDVGTEFDFTVSTKSVAGVGLTGGISLFMPQENYVVRHFYNLTDSDDPIDIRASEALSKANTDMTVWSYLQAVVNF